MTIYKQFKKLQDNLKKDKGLFISKFDINFETQLDYTEVFNVLFGNFYKESIFSNEIFNIKKLSRSEHTYIVFLLGYLVYTKLEDSQKNYFKNNHYENPKKHFQLIWFLTSIVHDIFFDIERKKEYKEFKDLNGDLNSVKKEFYIDNCLVSNSQYCDKLDKKFETFLGILGKYYKYRYCHDDRIDHGIVAGLVIFDLLVKHRIKKFSTSTSHWKEELDKLYFEAGLSIASHNIWSSDSKLKDKNYKDYGLEILVNSSKKSIFPIKFSEMPFLFLLGLVDTIEPTKTFRNRSVFEILNSLDINVTKNYLKLRNSKDSKLNFSELTKKVNGLENWLDVKLCIKQNEIKISWN